MWKILRGFSPLPVYTYVDSPTFKRTYFHFTLSRQEQSLEFRKNLDHHTGYDGLRGLVLEFQSLTYRWAHILLRMRIY